MAPHQRAVGAERRCGRTGSRRGVRRSLRRVLPRRRCPARLRPRLFRDRHVHALTVGVPGRITSSVSGSQLGPFDVTIDLRTVDAATVIGLLQRDGRAAS